jgi:D-alanine-D-alanine ligase
MDKLCCKRVWVGAGIPTPEYDILREGVDLNAVIQRLGFPLIVKPVREGSSFGISKVLSLQDLQTAWNKAAKFDDQVLVECCIEGLELTVGIIGEQVLPVIKVETPQDFYDYEAKYILDTTRYFCPSGLAAETEAKIQNLARRAFDAIGCGGWGRVDFMMDRQGRPFVLEVNTVPGMTDHSLVPKAAQQAGIGFDELVLRILETSDVAR